MFAKTDPHPIRPAEPVNPYLLAAREWDSRIGTARGQVRAWRLAALGLVAVTLMQTVALLGHLSDRTVTPLIVEVDRSGQEPRVINPATAFTPSDAQIAYQLRQWVTLVRRRTLDPVATREDILRAYDYLTEQSAAALNAYFQTVDVAAMASQHEAHQVQVSTVLRRSQHSWQITWTERVNRDGTGIGQYRYTALVTIAVQPPHTEADVYRNPLGIFIEAFDWSTES